MPSVGRRPHQDGVGDAQASPGVLEASNSSPRLRGPLRQAEPEASVEVCTESSRSVASWTPLEPRSVTVSHVSPARWQRLPSPRRDYTTGVVAAALFVFTTVMFLDEPSWLAGLTAGVMLLCAVTSFALARRRAARGRADRT
jgi:hypothetical protein